MSPLRVALFPADQTGCGFYRMHEPARVAAQTGEAAPTFPAMLRIRARQSFEADVVVVQRPAHRTVLDAIPRLQARGIAVVVDLDDDLACTHPANPAFAALHPSNPECNWHHLKRACQLADLVTVTTPALAQRYGGVKARVLPNCVPERLLSVAAERNGRTVGWAGFTVTHAGDLTATGGGVAQALSDTGARFLLVGADAADAQRQLGLPDAPEETGPIPFADYPEQVARLDVGIVPLKDNRFNAAKSGLKGLEYAALGVPFVASPTPDYHRLNTQGIGLLAGRGREWRREIRRLLTDPSYRNLVTRRARDQVIKRHTYERNGWRWAEAWAEAAAIRARSTRRAAA